MCAVCRSLLTSHWAEEGAGARERIARVALVNRVLGHFGLTLADWGGRMLVLRDRKGRSAVVDDVGTLWLEAERLLGRPLDPLDPGLVRSLHP